MLDHTNHTGMATKRLFVIHQGARSVAEYAVDFWTLAIDAGWNEPALQGAFRWGFSGLNTLVAAAIELDNHLRER